MFINRSHLVWIAACLSLSPIPYAHSQDGPGPADQEPPEDSMVSESAPDPEKAWISGDKLQLKCRVLNPSGQTLSRIVADATLNGETANGGFHASVSLKSGTRIPEVPHATKLEIASALIRPLDDNSLELLMTAEAGKQSEAKRVEFDYRNGENVEPRLVITFLDGKVKTQSGLALCFAIKR